MMKSHNSQRKYRRKRKGCTGERTGDVSANFLCVCAAAEAETPLEARRCPGKLCYSANGLLKAEHVKADALV